MPIANAFFFAAARRLFKTKKLPETQKFAADQFHSIRPAQKNWSKNRIDSTENSNNNSQKLMMIQNLSFVGFCTCESYVRYALVAETCSQSICLPFHLQVDSLALETKHRKNNINHSAPTVFFFSQQTANDQKSACRSVGCDVRKCECQSSAGMVQRHR